jgi:hypothetical protein
VARTYQADELAVLHGALAANLVVVEGDFVDQPAHPNVEDAGSYLTMLAVEIRKFSCFLSGRGPA